MNEPQTSQLSPDQVAELIGIFHQFLLAFMKAGALKFTGVGTQQRIALSDLLEFNERRLAAGEVATEAVASRASREQATVEAIEPISDEALTELDEL